MVTFLGVLAVVFVACLAAIGYALFRKTEQVYSNPEQAYPERARPEGFTQPPVEPFVEPVSLADLAFRENAITTVDRIDSVTGIT